MGREYAKMILNFHAFTKSFLGVGNFQPQAPG